MSSTTMWGCFIVEEVFDLMSTSKYYFQKDAAPAYGST